MKFKKSLTGIKRGLTTIRENYSSYTVSPKDEHSWACRARNIFNFTALLTYTSRYVNYSTTQKK